LHREIVPLIETFVNEVVSGYIVNRNIILVQLTCAAVQQTECNCSITCSRNLDEQTTAEKPQGLFGIVFHTPATIFTEWELPA
jgi:hypothetical protein